MTSLASWRHSGRSLWAAAGLSLASLVTPNVAYAQTAAPCEHAVLTLSEAATLLRIEADELRELAEQRALPSRRVASSWRFNCTALMAWLNGDWDMPARTTGQPAADPSSLVPHDPRSLLTTKDLAAVSGTGTAARPAQTPPTSESPAPDSQQTPVGEAPEERAAEDVFLRGQRVLLGRGDVVVDAGQFYSRSDDHLLAPVGGGVGLTTAEQQTFTTLFVGRVGIFEETELFASATFLSQRHRQFIGGTDLANERQSEFGGTNVGVRRTLLRETAGRPDIIATFSGYIPTGGRSRAVGGGLVFVKSVDPVVLFAGANYLHALGQVTANGTGATLGLEDRFDLSMGYGLALNDTLALSMSVSGAFAGPAARDDARPKQPSIFSGRIGLTSWLARGLYIEPSVSFALTGPGNSVAFGATLPYAF